MHVRRNGVDAVFEIFDYIGDYTTSTQDVASAIAETQGSIEVVISSGGGDLITGLSIYNLLAAHRARVTTRNIALAGSAASVIFMAGSKRIAEEGSAMMIHRSSSGTGGNADDLAAQSRALETFDAAMTAIYTAVTGQKESKITKLLEAETWMTAAEAMDLGFATAVAPSLGVAAHVLRRNKVRDISGNMDIRTLLSLKAEATDAEVEAEVTRLKAPAAPIIQQGEAVDVGAAVTRAVAEAFATREALMALQAGPKEAEQQLELAATALVERAIKAGKILPAQRKQAIAVAAKSQLALDSASSLWADSPVIVNREKVAPGTVPNADTIVLDAQQKRMCASSGVKEEDFIAQMKRDAERRARPAREEG